ncbi:Vegetative incompatibility protein HET-E-1, partial [Pseudocercospora fuligena]
MFRWYAEATVCIAYLHDVVPSIASPSEVIHSFVNSVWFTRGWTLQELLAPSLVVFLDQQWEVLGHKAPSRECAQLAWESRSIRPFNTKELRLPLNHWISTASGIPPEILADYSQSGHLSITEKRQWMKRRTTTRTEDAAYCLLGICGVYMPLIYGEREFAFERLEEAIENRRRRGAASRPVTTAESESHAPQTPEAPDTIDDDVESADAHRTNGNDAYKRGDYSTAVAEYSRDSGSSRSYQNRAAAYMSLKQYGEALKDCETANSIDPQNSKILARMERIRTALAGQSNASSMFAGTFPTDSDSKNHQNTSAPGSASYEERRPQSCYFDTTARVQARKEPEFRRQGTDEKQRRDQKYASFGVETDSETDTQNRGEEEERRAREAYYAQMFRQHRDAEEGNHSDERARKILDQVSDARDYIASATRGSYQSNPLGPPESYSQRRRRASPVRIGSTKDRVEYVKGKDGRPKVVVRRTGAVRGSSGKRSED